MTDWDWVTREGLRGELPVEIQPNRRAKFIDFVDDVVIERYDIPDGMKLIPGDICILTGEITDVDQSRSPTRIQTKVFDIEFIQKSDQRPDKEIKEMMKHLEEAKERSSKSQKCHYCSIVNSSTPLTIKRDLHACAKCGRILTTKEYNQTGHY